MSPAGRDRREITFRGTLGAFGVNHTEDGRRLLFRYLFVRGFADGSGSVIFQDTIEPVHAGNSRAEPDPAHEIVTLRLDAGQFMAFLEGAMRPIAEDSM